MLSTGSSREAAVVAHQGAGIELVVAHSFQRFFKRTWSIAGLPFTTDFGVLERLRSGEEIAVTEFHGALPDFFRQVAHASGLLPYGQDWLDGKLQPWYVILLKRPVATYKGLTVVEKRSPTALGLVALQQMRMVHSLAWLRSSLVTKFFVRWRFVVYTSTQLECAWHCTEKHLETSRWSFLSR